MKKISTKLVSLILSLALVLSICGCDWITVNTDRDMGQVVATVKVSDAVDAEDIYKKELNSGFLSYGYQYISYYGYTTSQAYQVVLDNLVANKIIMQQSRIELAKTYNSLLTKTSNLTEFEAYFKDSALANGAEIDPASNSVDNLKKYLSAYEYAQIQYETRKNINDLIESYEEEDDEEETEKEEISVTLRTTPTVEDETSDRKEADLKTATPTEDEQKIAEVIIGATAFDKTNVYDLDMAVFEAYEIDISTNAKKKAFSQLLTFLRDNGLVSSTESYELDDADNILKYEYFKDMSKSLMENRIVAKYEESLQAQTEDKLTNDGIWEEYVKEYNNQEALYKNDISAYETALGSVSDTSFVLYNPHSEYGYVLNLLIPFSDEQSTSLADYQSKAGITDAQIKQFRTNLAQNIVAKDQRESWVYSSYGKYDKENKAFSFGEDYLLSDLESIGNFVGEVIVRNADGLTEKDDNGVDQTTWYFENVIADEISMDDFFANYLNELGIQNLGDSVVGEVEYTDELFDKFNDLMYAFSTDEGCLGSYYGYLYSPYTTTYVEEFEAAAKAVVNKGAGAYTTVLTDYGYHVILCTKVVETVYSPSDKETFTSDLANEDSLAYKYREVKLNSIVSSEISKVASKLINEYKDDEDKVTYFPKTYSDLIEETEEE